MRDEAHIGLVDAHAESDGGDDHLALFHQKAVLMALPGFMGHASVIGKRGDAVVVQPLCGLFHFLARQTIHDAGVPGMLRIDEMQQLLAGIVLLYDAVADVGAVESADEGPGLFQAQAPGYFLPGSGVGGGGQGDPGHLGELFVQQR